MVTDEDMLRRFGEYTYEPRGIHYSYLRSKYSIFMCVGESKKESDHKLLGKIKNRVMQECDWLYTSNLWRD